MRLSNGRWRNVLVKEERNSHDDVVASESGGRSRAMCGLPPGAGHVLGLLDVAHRGLHLRLRGLAELRARHARYTSDFPMNFEKS